MPHYFRQTDSVQFAIDEMVKAEKEKTEKKEVRVERKQKKTKKKFRFKFPEIRPVIERFRFYIRDFFERITENKDKIWGTLKIALAVFSFTAFMQFIIEEAVQMQSFGAWPIISNKNISVAEKVGVINRNKKFHEKMKVYMDGLSLINPFSGFFFEQFMEGNEERIDSYYRSVFGISMKEVEKISSACELVEIGQKCRAVGYVFGIKTDKDWTSIVIGRNTMPKNPEYRDAGEEELEGEWITTRVKANYSLGELIEIYEMKDKPRKGDWIEVVGIKEKEGKETDLRLGYLLIWKPKN